MIIYCNSKISKKKKLLDNTPDQPSNLRQKNWFEITDDTRGTHKTNSQIKLETLMLKSSLCDYSDAWILVKGTITIVHRGVDQASKQRDKRIRGVIFENFTSFTDCTSEINNIQVDNAKGLDVVMSVYSDNCSKVPGSLWQYYRGLAKKYFSKFGIIQIQGTNTR